jgi:hypothetical protein
MESIEHLNCLFNRIKSFLESTTELTLSDDLKLYINHNNFVGLSWWGNTAKRNVILFNDNNYTIFEIFSNINFFFSRVNLYDQEKLEKSDFAKISKHLTNISDPHELEIQLDLLGI